MAQGHQSKLSAFKTGFTIVELLIVIVVIGILAAITIVAFNGVTAKANDTKRISDIKNVAKIVNAYYAQNGSFPTTGAATTAILTDSNCDVGSKSTNWVPGVVPEFTSALPQSDGKQPNGTNTGCYKYWSNGTYFVISAWIGASNNTQTSTFYHRAGFREASNGSAEQYYCNHPAMGGMGSGAGPYNINSDLYKKSFTITSDVTPNNTLNGACNETPPAGA